MEINKIIDTIVDILKVDKVKINRLDHFYKTNSGGYDPIKNAIGLKRHYPTEFDEIFALAHEYRHVWQFKNKIFDFSTYKKREDCANIDEYNNQSSEIDANAFGCIIIDLITDGKVKPLFDNFSQKTKDNIFKRKNVLVGLMKEGKL